MAESKLSTQPYKGARDFYPEDMRLRNYIFETWTKVCKSYGYKQYDGPFIESFDLYAAKSGDELVNEQLYSFVDRGERKVAIRPEMTPTVARMVAQKLSELPTPIRWFSIPNLWRYEKPQKGRLREHYQLNVDVFGSDQITAEWEILSIIADILKAFGAKENMFEIRFNNRRFVESFFSEIGIKDDQKLNVIKAIDKKSKITESVFKGILTETLSLDERQYLAIVDFLGDPEKWLITLSEKSEGAKEVNMLMELSKKTELSKFLKLDSTIMRGLDYYTGTVFELFDITPENNRAMCGGGRYDDLISLFSSQKLSGIGFGMGDVTFRNFLENWGLLPNFEAETEYLVTLWPGSDAKYIQATIETAQALRKKGKKVEIWLDNSKLEKQLKYADKTGIKSVLIIGEEEVNNGTITVKDMTAKTQISIPLEEFLTKIV